ncbi:unnamed protein product [Acanthoscelides obtectus]|uniref:Enolase n=1 Tax=Acanthoscelides obtectus TaxID=200917 RepID=A0A9P0MIE3_ACAOB|nr:unnamed protein product [Acanthoscelides obtectus]CAK1626621.1 Enolase [Acanthoscelides obtectus]
MANKKCMKHIFARMIFDSRGNPTVEVDLITDLGLFRAAVPSGASTGIHEALELRDGIPTEYHGKGVSKAISNINDIIGPELLKKEFDVTQQREVDEFMIELDGTPNMSRFGANAILGISLVVCKAGAAKRGLPLYKHIADLAGNSTLILPVPAFNVINGGSHAGNKLAMQFYFNLKAGSRSYIQLSVGWTTNESFLSMFSCRFGLDATAVGDEGGFAPNIPTAKDALVLLRDAIAKAGYTGRIDIGIDVAASEFYKGSLYNLDFKNPKSDKKNWMKPEKLLDLYKTYLKEFPIVSIEDPFDQDDWKAWTAMTASVDIQIVGDDLTVTNPVRIQKAADEKACNCLLLKVNQIGTITQAIEAHKLAKENGWGTMVSHRSGETEDTFIADLVVGLGTGQIKTGAPCRSERCAKYNQIMRIEEEVGVQ